MHIKRNTALKNKELIQLGFIATVVLVCVFELCYKELKIIKIEIRTYLLLYTWSKMFSLSLNALLKLFKTISPQKLFPSDCITLYIMYI